MIGRPVGSPELVSVAVTVLVVSWGALGDPGAGSTWSAGIGVVGASEQEPSAFVTRTTRSSWLAYRQPSGPTAAKSPRDPPVKMSVSVGVEPDTSIRVMIPSFRLA